MAFACWTVLVACASACAPATAAEPAGNDRARLDDMVRYLQQAQSLDGGFPAAPGGEPSPDFTAWAALALAAAGINPQQQAAPGGESAYSYLLAHASELTLTTDFERELLVVEAAGALPQNFAGRNLVTEILKRQIAEGSEAGAFEHEAGKPSPGVNDTVFAILALSPIHEEATTHAIERAREWLLKVQNPGAPQQGGGSWPAVQPDTIAREPEHNVEMTGAAIQALNASGVHHSEAQARAIAFLHDAQQPDGGFPSEMPGEGEANVASTAWVVQGIWSAAENPETWVNDGHEPLGYMESMQREDGSLQFDASSYENPVWITAYAGLAFAGAYLPLAPVPLAEPAPPPSGQSSSGAAGTSQSPAGETGQGGYSPQSGAGVIAGGGGAGAQPFSRPQPASKGHTPGGARRLTRYHRRADAAKRRDPVARKATGPLSASPEPASQGSHDGRGEGVAKKTTGAAGDSGGASGLGRALAEANRAAARAGDPDKVSGLLLGDSLAALHGPSADGAPGLRGAGAGGDESSWPALAIALGALALALLGARLERRRARVAL